MNPHLSEKHVLSSEFPPHTPVWVEAALDGSTRRRFATVQGPCPGAADNLLGVMLSEAMYEYLGKPTSVTLRLVEEFDDDDGAVQLQFDFSV